MKKNKVVIDTNIFIKGWFFEDENYECQRIMELIDNRKIQLLFSQDTIGELMYLVKNFARHNIDDINTRVILLQSISELFYYATSVNTIDTFSPKINDEYDIMFVKCAIEGKADYLITNDFRSGMHNIKNMKFKAVTAQEYIDILEKEAVAVGIEK